MKFATVLIDGKSQWGAITDDGFISAAALENDPLANMIDLDDVVQTGALHDAAKAFAGARATHKHGTFTYDKPLSNSRRIICVGVNFPDRNAEYKDGSNQPENMSLFPRFPSSFTGHGQNLIRPPESEKLDYEGEMAVVIGKAGRRISQADAYDHIAALTICNEGTIRDWVRHAKFNVTQGKNWDNSGAIGPWLVPFTDASQIDDATLETRVNGELRQEDEINRMMFPIRRQIEYISTFTTLEPGDIIITGTPTGSGARFDPPIFLKPGDEVSVTVSTVGTLTNGVADE